MHKAIGRYRVLLALLVALAVVAGPVRRSEGAEGGGSGKVEALPHGVATAEALPSGVPAVEGLPGGGPTQRDQVAPPRRPSFAGSTFEDLVRLSQEPVHAPSVRPEDLTLRNIGYSTNPRLVPSGQVSRIELVYATAEVDARASLLLQTWFVTAQDPPSIFQNLHPDVTSLEYNQHNQLFDEIYFLGRSIARTYPSGLGERLARQIESGQYTYQLELERWSISGFTAFRLLRDNLVISGAALGLEAEEVVSLLSSLVVLGEQPQLSVFRCRASEDGASASFQVEDR